MCSLLALVCGPTPSTQRHIQQTTEGYLGGGGDLEAFLRHARPQTPKPVKPKSSTLIHDCPKDSVILASAMTQSGVLGKEMKVYVDKENM